MDCIVFADVLEHLEDPAGALTLAADLLAPAGRVVASVPDASWAPVARTLATGEWEPTLAGVQARDHLAVFTRTSFEKLAQECGLEVDEELPLQAPLPLSLRFWAWMAARAAGKGVSGTQAPQWVLSLRRK
jgi:hypothetical protein